MAYISQYEYYENNGNSPEEKNWGSYQYISLADIVNNFLLMYVGNNSLITKEDRFKILFHAKRAIQELNYDAFKEIKILQLTVGDDLRFILPSDFVNWVRISLYNGGALMPLSENIQTQTSRAYLQDHNAKILFDEDGNILEPQYSQLDWERLQGTAKSIYLDRNKLFFGQYGYYFEGKWYFDFTVGSRYGLNTETANTNPTFTIDKKTGVINFSSNMLNELCVLEYVSDGMENGDDSLVSVNKMFESYVYAYIQYELLKSKLGVQEYIIARALKEKMALYRNAKIRLSDIHAGRLLMNLRGQHKIIK
ncbi:hypothetical protein [Caudoviricetes sp.]|nr:hypothetical protein [Caudoviricetes sp.]